MSVVLSDINKYMTRGINLFYLHQSLKKFFFSFKITMLFMLPFNIWASLVAQLVKNPPAMRETSVRSLGREDPREKEMATHSSILAWKIPWTEEPAGLQSMEFQRVGHN